MGTFGLSEKNRVAMLIIEHHIWATELQVHVSRLLMPHLDRDQWKRTMFTNYTLYFSMPLYEKSCRYVQGNAK